MSKKSKHLAKIITNRSATAKVERAEERFDKALLYLSGIPGLMFILLIIMLIFWS